MANSYYNNVLNILAGQRTNPAIIEEHFDDITLGFDKLPTLAGNGGKVVSINAGGTAMETIPVTGSGSILLSESPAMSGIPTAPTATTGTSTTQIATTAFVTSTAFNAALPAQAGNAGKAVVTDGANASWQDISTPLSQLHAVALSF